MSSPLSKLFTDNPHNKTQQNTTATTTTHLIQHQKPE